MKINWAQMWSMEEERSPEEQPELNEVMDRVASGITERHLGIPALWMLESVKPLSFIGSQAMVFFSPIAGLFGDGRTYGALTRIFASRELTENFIDTIERLEMQSNKPAEKQLSEPAASERLPDPADTDADAHNRKKSEKADE